MIHIRHFILLINYFPKINETVTKAFGYLLIILSSYISAQGFEKNSLLLYQH